MKKKKKKNTCSAGKNFECNKAGLMYLRRLATSLVSLKYGSWSMAHGIKQGISVLFAKISGNVLENEGAAWTEGKWYFPMESLSVNPNVDLAWLPLIHLDICTTFL